MQMNPTVRVQAAAGRGLPNGSRVACSLSVRRAASRGLVALLASTLVVLATDGAAAKTKKPRAVDEHLGYSDLLQISTPTAPVPAPVTAAPVRFFTIQKVLEKVDAAGGIAAAGTPAKLAALPPTTATDAGTGIGAALPTTNEPFSLTLFRAPEGELWVKWRTVQGTIAQDVKTLAACRADRDACSSEAAKRFLAVLDEARTKADASARIAAVNRLVNSAVRYTSDMAQWGVPDRWSPPLETFASGQGDCEDYAIAKYVALLELGFDPRDLKVLLVKDTRLYQDHAVLAVRQDGHWLILDNRWSLVVEDSEARSLVALYALDDEGVQLFAAPYASRLQGADVAVAPSSPGVNAKPQPGMTELPLPGWSGASCDACESSSNGFLARLVRLAAAAVAPFHFFAPPERAGALTVSRPAID